MESEFKLHPELQDVLEEALLYLEEKQEGDSEYGFTGCGVQPQQLLAAIITRALGFFDSKELHELWVDCVEANVPDAGLPDSEF